MEEKEERKEVLEVVGGLFVVEPQGDCICTLPLSRDSQTLKNPKRNCRLSEKESARRYWDEAIVKK